MDSSSYIVLLIFIFYILSRVFKGVRKGVEAVKKKVEDREEEWEDIDTLDEPDFFESIRKMMRIEDEKSIDREIVEGEAVTESNDVPTPLAVNELMAPKQEVNVEGKVVEKGRKAVTEPAPLKGMSKEEKRKLIIYSEVMSPKYKEY